MQLPRRSQRPERGTTRQKRREETRQRLLAAGRELFGELGYIPTTTRAIAERAGVSVGSVFSHFDSKADLLMTIIRENNSRQFDIMQTNLPRHGTTLERLLWLVRTGYVYDLEDPRLLAVMQAYTWVWPADTEAENAADRGRFCDFVLALLKDGQQSGEVDGDADLAAAVRAIFAVYTWGMRPAVFDGATPDECVAKLKPEIEIVLRGLSPA